MPTHEELGAAAFVGAVFVTIPVAAGLTYLDSKWNGKNEGKKKEGEKDAASDGKGGK